MGRSGFVGFGRCLFGRRRIDGAMRRRVGERDELSWLGYLRGWFRIAIEIVAKGGRRDSQALPGLGRQVVPTEEGTCPFHDGGRDAGCEEGVPHEEYSVLCSDGVVDMKCMASRAQAVLGSHKVWWRAGGGKTY